MSECHDIYDPIEGLPRAQQKVMGTQCHDPYPLVAADSAPASPAHECHLVSGHRGSVRLVRVIGRLDWASEGRFSDLMRHECPDREVIIDLSKTDSDAAGTGALLAAASRARSAKQQLVFVVTDPAELRVLAYTGLDQVMPVVGSESEALEWLEAHAVAAASSTTA